MNKAQSRDEIERNRVTYLMKTPMETLIKSKKYKNFIKDSIKQHGRAWWYFANMSVKSHRQKPWLWRFKDGKE